jgi:Protein of unknown function (DUF2865)
MRIRQALMSCAVSITLSIAMAPPAVAQSFFQKLFGFGDGQPAPQMATRPQTQTIPPHRFEYRPRPHQQSQPDGDDDEIGPPDSGGPYRTMCVRSCDGFYFPLRHNAKRRNFASDAKSCRSACGTEARLFYYSLNEGSTETMVDLAGRKYKDLPHAFGFRKALVQGCACKPVPWSYEEAARHRQYETADAVAAATKETASAKKSDTSEKSAEVVSQDSSKAGAVTASDVKSTSEAGVASADQAEPASADKVAQKTIESYEPMRIKPDKTVFRRRKTRDVRVITRRVAFQPASQPASGWGFFGPSKSKNKWIVD